MNIRKIIWQFQQHNQKAYYLAFLRVAVCCWFLKELLFRWPAFEMLYSNNSFLKIGPSASYYMFHLNLVWLKGHYTVFIAACVILLLLNVVGVGRNLVSILVFLALTLLYHVNDKFLNSGDDMALLLLFYLSFADTFCCLTLFKKPPVAASMQKVYNLLSNLCAYGIMLNLCVAYFISGLSKTQDAYWLRGTAIYYFLNDNRYSVFAANGNIVPPAMLVYIINYGTILFEISFAFLVWFKPGRNIALLTGLIMHLCIYFFLMIYGMSIIFIIQYGLFFSNEEIIAVVKKIKQLMNFKTATLTKTTAG